MGKWQNHPPTCFGDQCLKKMMKVATPRGSFELCAPINHPKHVLKPTPGVAKWLVAGDVAIARRCLMSHQDGEVATVCGSTSHNHLQNSIDLLRVDSDWDVQALRDGFKVWRTQTSECTLESEFFEGKIMKSTVEKLIFARAFEHSDTKFTVVRDEVAAAFDMACLRDLERAGLVLKLDEDEHMSMWQVKVVGIAQLNPVLRLSDPEPALAIREVEETAMTTWELWELLTQSWEVEVWVPERKRRPPPYGKGGQKIIFVNANWERIPRLYLLALAKADSIHEKVGIAIVHWREKWYYSDLLEGKVPRPPSSKKSDLIEHDGEGGQCDAKRKKPRLVVDIVNGWLEAAKRMDRGGPRADAP